MDKEEPLLKENIHRHTLFPIEYDDIYKMFKDAEKATWTADEIDFSSDRNDWEKLSNDEKYFIEHILAFFAGSDGIVLENLMNNFAKEIQIPEARAFYAHQAYIETVHQESYAKMIDTLVKNPERKINLFHALNKIPCIKNKGDWALKWTQKGPQGFASRLLGFIIVEGIFFCSSFCAIFWLKENNKLRGALAKSNELIARDERLHTQFGILLYSKLINKLKENTVHDMIKEAVDIEIEFITQSIPCSLIGMNKDLMIQYVKYVSDNILIELRYNTLFNVKSPFHFMDKLDQSGVTNFFDERVSEYTKGIKIDDVINLDDEF